MAGTLYIVGVPIGHPEDITLRAIRVLQDVALIVAEHPQVTRRLIDRFGVATSMSTYDADGRKAAVLTSRLRDGESIAIVCDAGMPAIWDPGQRLIERVLAEGIRVCPIGATSAVIAAIAASGLESDGFIFAGTLPSARRAPAMLEEIINAPRPVVLFVSGRRLRRFVKMLRARLPTRVVVIAADLGTPRERILRATAKAIASKLQGEILEATVVIDRKARRNVSES